MPPRRELPPLPNFLIIGAQRCATRWLRFNLDKHPDIYAPTKELNFFNDPDRIAEWKLYGYRWAFDGWDGEPFLGEASPNYMRPSFGIPETSKRIAKMLPDVKLIAIVRNPIDRLDSAIRHYIKIGRLRPRDDLLHWLWGNAEIMEELDLISAGQYVPCLRPYLGRFHDRLLILFHDDIVADPAEVYRQAVRHIGATDDFVPADIDRVMYSTQQNVRFAPPEPHERAAGYALFRPSVAQLEELTGRDLSHWAPPGSEDIKLVFDRDAEGGSRLAFEHERDAG